MNDDIVFTNGSVLHSKGDNTRQSKIRGAKDLMLVDGLDQSLPVAVEEELKQIDELMDDAIRDKDPDIMFNYMVEWQKHFQLGGLALCKSCYLMNKYWDTFTLGDNFLDTASDYLGIHRHTVERYVKVWEMLQIAPKHLVSDLQQKNVRTLVPVANAVAQGFEIEDHIWERIADAPDYTTAQHIINEEVTHSEGRSNKLTLFMDRNGSLWAITPTDRYFIGSLEIEDERDVVQKAIFRIIKGSGVMRQ